MDTTVLYTILICAGVIASYFGITYLKKKKLIDSETVSLITNGLGLTSEIIDELQMKNEKQLKQIITIVTDAVNYTNEAIKVSGNEVKIDVCYKYAIQLALDLNLTLTDSRKQLMLNLITQTFKVIK